MSEVSFYTQNEEVIAEPDKWSRKSAKKQEIFGHRRHCGISFDLDSQVRGSNEVYHLKYLLYCASIIAISFSLVKNLSVTENNSPGRLFYS